MVFSLSQCANRNTDDLAFGVFLTPSPEVQTQRGGVKKETLSEARLVKEETAEMQDLRLSAGCHSSTVREGPDY